MTNKEAMKLLGIAKGQHGYKRLLRYMRSTEEHLVRRCEGESNSKSNLVVAHMYCNSSRGDLTVQKHKELTMEKIKGGYHPLSVLGKNAQKGEE